MLCESKDRCKSCWWQEGGKCYNSEFANITTHELFQEGELISCLTLESCAKNTGYLNKREALSSVIPNEKLVITSETKK